MSYGKPLEGVKVVEMSTIVTASLATMMMADQGAEVIKIEQSGIGDPMRYLGTQKGGVSALFANCNRGKRSIDLNLKEKEDLEIVKKLIGAEVNNSSISAIVDDLSKKNGDKYYGN